jgi:hypothetical protein
MQWFLEVLVMLHAGSGVEREEVIVLRRVQMFQLYTRKETAIDRAIHGMASLIIARSVSRRPRLHVSSRISFACSVPLFDHVSGRSHKS